MKRAPSCADDRRALFPPVGATVAEYARHNGHADLISERIDGQTGE
jgi:hypothetical protein